MNAEPASGAVPLPAPSSNQELVATLRRVAWLSILLGLLIEIVILIVKLGFDEVGGLVTVVNDTIQKVAWPFLVCLGVAFGQSVAKARPPGVRIRTMGIAGLLAAPVAFTAVRILHKGVGTALGQAGDQTAMALILLLAIVKAAQYGSLGALIARLQARPSSTARQHALLGLAVGVVFGGASVLLTALAAESIKPVNVVTQGINEVLVPVGCALILYVTKILSQRLG